MVFALRFFVIWGVSPTTGGSAALARRNPRLLRRAGPLSLSSPAILSRPLHTHHDMKTKRIVGVVVLIAIVTALAYGVGYQHGSRASRTVVTLASLRQVGLSFRTDRNDIGYYRATGGVIAPTPPAQPR